MKKTKWQLTINEEQAFLLKVITEFFARLTSGQVDEVFRILSVYSPDGRSVSPYHSTCKELEAKIRSLFFPELSARSNHGIGSEQLNDACSIAWDLYQVIRRPLCVKRNGECVETMNVECKHPHKNSRSCELASFKEVEETACDPIKVRFSGVTIPTNGRNQCYIQDCRNDACTAVFINNSQTDVCGLHLKKKFESGEWVAR